MTCVWHFISLTGVHLCLETFQITNPQMAVSSLPNRTSISVVGLFIGLLSKTLLIKHWLTRRPFQNTGFFLSNNKTIFVRLSCHDDFISGMMPYYYHEKNIYIMPILSSVCKQSTRTPEHASQEQEIHVFVIMLMLTTQRLRYKSIVRMFSFLFIS